MKLLHLPVLQVTFPKGKGASSFLLSHAAVLPQVSTSDLSRDGEGMQQWREAQEKDLPCFVHMDGWMQAIAFESFCSAVIDLRTGRVQSDVP